MYQDDSEALHQLAVSATEEAERLRRENAVIRAAVGQAASQPMFGGALSPRVLYTSLDLRTLPLEERARLARHTVRPFPVWAAAVLNVVTFGLFSLIHFGLVHGRLPQASTDDPSAGKSIGYAFIPWYNLYWVFFNSLRLCDRLTLQFRLRGMTDRAPRGLVLGACICFVIPYVGFLIGLPIIWTIAVCRLQASVNRVAKLDPDSWDASLLGPVPEASSAPGSYSAELAALAGANRTHA